MGTEAVSFPFYRLSRDAVIASSGWQVTRVSGTESGSEALGGGIENWDYQVDLDFSRNLSLNTPAVLEDCGLKDGSTVRILVLVSTGGQRMRRRVFSQDLRCSADLGQTGTDMAFRLAGASLQGDIRIDTEICVVSAVARTIEDPFVPVTKGSRIWSDSVTTALEGSLSRFPMSSVSFQKAFGDVGNAAWMLHWSPDRVESSASAAMRLYFNEDSSLFQQLVECDPVLCGLVEVDVLRQVLVTLLADDDFDITPDIWPEHSLGKFAAQWILNIFGDDSPEVLRSRFRSEPGWIDARIQSFLRSTDGG